MTQRSRQVTLRGIPNDLFRRWQREAQQRRMSMNQWILEHLLPRSGTTTEGLAQDLLAQAGTWDQKRARDFERHCPPRTIDPELWK